LLIKSKKKSRISNTSSLFANDCREKHCGGGVEFYGQNDGVSAAVISNQLNLNARLLMKLLRRTRAERVLSDNADQMTSR